MKHKTDFHDLMTVVIIAKDRQKDLLVTLEQLSRLPERFPIIVVDNASTDGTPEIVAEQFPQVQLIGLTENMGALGRNIGVEAAKTPYIAFCDDDSWWQAGAMAKAVDYFERYPQVGLIAGRILVKDEQSLDPTSAMQSISPLKPWVDMPGPAILGFLGCGIFVRRQAFLEVGGYNEHIYFSGEEELLGIDMAAAGWGMTYCHDIVGHHYASTVRNMPERYRMGARNVVLAAWMRRPWRSAVGRVWGLANEASRDWNKFKGMMDGLVRLPGIVSERRVVPQWLEDSIALLEDQHLTLAKKAALAQRKAKRVNRDIARRKAAQGKASYKDLWIVRGG